MLYVNFKDVGARNIAPAKIGREKDRQNLNALQSTSVNGPLLNCIVTSYTVILKVNCKKKQLAGQPICFNSLSVYNCLVKLYMIRPNTIYNVNG